MTITITTNEERAIHIFNDGGDDYTAELIKRGKDLFDVKLTFPDYFDASGVAMMLFHVGSKFGINKARGVMYKPDQFKDITNVAM